MNNPVRLNKVEEKPMSKIEQFLLGHANIILPILMIVLLLLIIGVIWSIATMGGGNMTMVESGNYYYHLQDVI